MINLFRLLASWKAARQKKRDDEQRASARELVEAKIKRDGDAGAAMLECLAIAGLQFDGENAFDREILDILRTRRQGAPHD